MKYKKLYIGIDPGLKGAAALINDDGDILSIQDTPIINVKKGKGNKNMYLPPKMVSLISAFQMTGRVARCGIENVHAMPGQGVTSMFSMGTGFGLWLGILVSLEIPYTLIEPARWKKELHIKAGSDKRASALYAMRMFPKADLIPVNCRVPSDGRADALLIAEFTRRFVP